MTDIRFLDPKDWEEAISLTYRTFLEFDAPYFEEEGITQFRKFISDNALKRMFETNQFEVIGAYENDRLVGVIALRQINHISLFFVDRDYQNQGIGKKLITSLIDYVSVKLKQSYITVNSSPYAEGFYHKIGFFDLDERIAKDGIIFTPMKYICR